MQHDWSYYYQTPFLSDWGFGTREEGYVRNDRPYDWYIDQADTGPCADNNCGPSSTVMAIKWYDAGFRGSAAVARERFPANNGWWYTSDVINYFAIWSVPNTVSSFTGTSQLTTLLSQGQLIILCINTALLSLDGKSDHRVGRFYGYASGHILVLKGWRRVDGLLFFECYDPNNWHAIYSDKSPKGRNRHFPPSQLSQAIEKWWNFIIVVHPRTGGGGGGGSPRLVGLVPVDPTRIEHRGGM
jgi:hypothetical protein